MESVEKIREYIEPKAFGVCSYLGEKIGIASAQVRLFFIYTTFISNWSPLMIYLILAFWLNLRNYIGSFRSNNIRDL